MTDHQYYNGNASSYTSNKPSSLNKSISAALSRENLHQYRRTEPKHLQPPPSRTGGPNLNYDSRHNQPDLIKDYRDPNGKTTYRSQPAYDSSKYQTQSSSGDPNHHGYQSSSDYHGYQNADALRRSQGTNTKHPQREFLVHSPSKTQKGEFVQDSHAFNGVASEDQPNGQYRERERSQYAKSRGVSTNETALEVINMNYNSIQQQMERTLLSKNHSTSRMKSEELTNGNGTFSSSLNKMGERQHLMDSSYVDPLSRTIRNSDSGSSSHSKTMDRSSDGSANLETGQVDRFSYQKPQATDRLSSFQSRISDGSSHSQSRMTDRLSSSQHQPKLSDRLSSSQNKSFDLSSSSQNRMTDRQSSSLSQSSSQLRNSEITPKPQNRSSTSYHHSLSSSTDENKRNTSRMNPENVTRNRSKTPVDGLQIRRQIAEDFSQRAVNYQQFTQDKVSPIIPSAARRQVMQGEPRVKSLEAEDSPNSRARPPPHERTSRLTKENLEQLRKPRNDALKNRDIIDQKSSNNPGIRQQPMGAEAVPRPATSMGFDRSRLPPHINQSQNKEAQQMILREKLQHLQRRKSSGMSPDPSKRENMPRPESRTQRWAERKRSYTTSTPDKRQSHSDQARPISRGPDAMSKGSRVLADTTNIEGIRKSHLFENEKSRDPMRLDFQERSANRWREIDRLMSSSVGDSKEDGSPKNKDPARKLDYPFFSEFSRNHRYISTSLDSLNQEATQHLSDSNKMNKHLLASNNLDADFQGTPQLSSPVDFDPENAGTTNGSYPSSSEDLDLEVSNLLLAHPYSQSSPDPIQMALYQKLIDQKIHDKMSVVRDQRFKLEKKDGEMKFRREKLQRRMQDMLARTNTVLNKSLELNKSRSFLEAELQEQVRTPENAQELTLIHALSTTIRPDNSSRNQNRRKSHDNKHDAPAYTNLPHNSQHDREEYV